MTNTVLIFAGIAAILAIAVLSFAIHYWIYRKRTEAPLPFPETEPEEVYTLNVILDAITEAQTEYILNSGVASITAMFERLLPQLFQVSNSTHGFVLQFKSGEVPVIAKSTIAIPANWAEFLNAYPELPNHAPGILSKIYEMIHYIMQHSSPCIENNLSVTRDIHHLIGIPLIVKGRLMGILGLGNKEIPYTQDVINQIFPVVQLCAIMMKGLHNEEEIEKTISLLQERDEMLNTYLKKLMLQNKELQEARDAAMHANKAKTMFLANMSHDIRTPLNGIMGMVQLLLNTDLNEKQSKYAQTVYDSSDVLLSLINDILDISKIEAGLLKFEEVECNIPEIVHEIEALLLPKAEQNNDQVKVTIEKGVPQNLLSDPVRLRQILTNLMGNAVKFTHDGNVHVTVVKIADEEENILIRFEIKDNGVGIPTEKQQDIFKPFVQAETSNTRKFGGTGLGLAISKQLVERMGGRIGFTSTPNKGSTFWFELPMKEHKALQEASR